MRSARKQKLKSKKKTRHLVYLTVAMLMFIYLTFIVIAGDNGLIRYIKLRSERDRMLAENRVIKQQNAEMSDRIQSYDSDPELFEGLAREYGLTREGELIFKFDDKE